uniref:DDE-type integrase/transposase/recombinase n=1 Tax=Muricauda brasiliensis TaxID=2162892 RepID=UPI000D3D2191
MKIVGWGWYYLSTILDDYSRYIIHWKLCPSMNAGDVKKAVARALEKVSFPKGKCQGCCPTTGTVTSVAN